MLQAYGKTPSEWGELAPDERYFLERAWRAEGKRKQEQRERIEKRSGM